MRIVMGLILLAALGAPPAAAAFKTDIRDITIGMTPEQVSAALTGCKHRDPTNIWMSAKDPSGAWVGQSSMICRVAGEPESTLNVTFTSRLSGKTACRIDYAFPSSRTNDALVADVMEQFEVGNTKKQSAGVYVWWLSSDLELMLTIYMQRKTLSLRNDGLCDRDKKAVADYRDAQQNRAQAPDF
jgi:hypothetical protein